MCKAWLDIQQQQLPAAFPRRLQEGASAEPTAVALNAIACF